MEVQAKPTPTPVALAARDALMKYEQQWEHIASKGHVLLARVEAYQHKVKLAFAMLSAAFVVALLSQWLPQRVGALVGAPVGKVASWFERKPEAPAMSPAPTIKPIAPQLPQQVTDASSMPSMEVIRGALEAAGENIKKGEGIKGCDTASKVTAAWATTESFVPHCRYSADKSRTWVWGVMSIGNQFGPFMALVRKDDKGAVVINNVQAVGSQVGTYPALDLNMVPRAVAADFPELTEGAKQ